MSEKVFQRKTWMLYLAVLLVLLKPITAHAAEDKEAYRAVFDADYYYNHDLLDVCKTDLSAYCRHYTAIVLDPAIGGNEYGGVEKWCLDGFSAFENSQETPEAA